MSLAEIVATIISLQDTVVLQTAPNVAPADFTAGGFSTFWGQNVKTEIEACMTQSDKLTQDLEALINTNVAETSAFVT